MTLASEADTSKAPAKLHTIRYDAPAAPKLPDGITVSVEHGEGDDAEGGDDGNGLIYNDDGSITVADTPEDKPKKINRKNFDANLAEEMDESDLSTLASELVEMVDEDLRSRREWEDTFTKGIDLLGLTIEQASAVTSGGGNISKVKDPLLLEAVLTYQSNFNANMLPADGPVKVRDDKVQVPEAASPQVGAPGGVAGTAPVVSGAPTPGGPPPGMGHNGGPPMGGEELPPGALPPPMGGLMSSVPPQPQLSRAQLANAFQTDFNKYLTVTDKAYYPDTDRMSFSQALGGCAFKKIYSDPLEKRPISRFVMANHLIVNNGASSLHDAKRVTHWIPKMSHLTYLQMVEAGAYREVDLSTPISDPGTVDTKISEVQGTQARVDRPEDRDYNFYEVYTWRNLPGFEAKNSLPMPYRITVDKDSRQVVEVRRNWKQGDPLFKPRRRFVKYPLFPGLGFYDYGFVHILGNTTRVLSAIESLMVDGGMFANFPGGMIDQTAAKQETNQIRPGPGGFKPINTGGRPIQQVVMAMPYKDVSPAMMQLAAAIQTNARKLGSIAELPIAEGAANMPVGTVLALIEQSKVMESAVHRRNFAAQHEEFEILKELFAEDPEALSRTVKNPARKWEEAEEFEDTDLIPAADPNTSSKVQRIGKASALVQILQQSPPGLLNPKEILTRAFTEMGLEDIDKLFLPPSPQPPQPHQIDAQLKAAGLQQKAQADEKANATKLQLQQMENADHAQQRASAEKIEGSRLQIQAMKDAQEFQQGITPPDGMAPGGFGGRPTPAPPTGMMP